MNSPQEKQRIAKGLNDRSKKLNFLIIGQSGAGKSTTINRILDGCKETAPASAPGSVSTASVTKDPLLYNGFLYDRPCGIIDQAGFGDTEKLKDSEIMSRALMYVAMEVP